MTEKPKTRLDSILEGIKNHRALVWVLILGLIVTAIGQMAGSFSTILKFVREVRPNQSATGRAPVPETTKANPAPADPIAVDPPECRYLLVVPFVQIPRNSLMAEVTMQGLEAVISIDKDTARRSATAFEKPSVFVMKNYDAEDYALTVAFGKVSEYRKTFSIVKPWRGEISITEAQFYLAEPTPAFHGEWSSDKIGTIDVRPLSPNGQTRYFEQYGPAEMPDCKGARAGLS